MGRQNSKSIVLYKNMVVRERPSPSFTEIQELLVEGQGRRKRKESVGVNN